MSRPFSIKIFIPSGDPDGLRVIEKSNWTGSGLVFNRSIYQESRVREEFERTGVYILVGESDSSTLPTVYIGEGDPVKPRLEQHYSKKDFWSWCIFFTSKDGSLNKAHVKHLESRLIEKAKEAKQCSLDNIQDSQLPTLTEAEKADAESFLLDMLSIFPLVGLNIFEAAKKPKSKNKILYISAKGLSGSGYESPNGFTVCKGTQVFGKVTKSADKFISTIRADLLNQKVIIPDGEHYIFTQDYSFSSVSSAASVVLARNANGRIEWKDKSGNTLKKLQEGSVKML
jgi:hypothetical protein